MSEWKNSDRPSAEEMLRRFSQNNDESPRGRLKIFFGYAAGVGKTYAMLEAAHNARRHGVDVVAGYIEPHTRPETMALLDGLEVMPPKVIEYRNITLNEFDIDAAIERHPQLILIDELAHTNAEGSRHIKRYQDIQEILKNGIDVYTTVNVQHLESLNDQVCAITGITVRERVPDTVFDRADQVELVDIEPKDLIQRLEEGRIYRRKQAGRALNNFFTLSNLTALREISLRRCADRMNLRGKSGPDGTKGGYTSEHILVCLSTSPSNPTIIRTASRLASAFKARFTALYVETGPREALSHADNRRLEENMRLARQLGAVIETVYDDDVASSIIGFAREFKVSKIVMGRTGTSSGLFRFRPSLVDRLTQMADHLDIYIIPDSESRGKPGRRKFRFAGLNLNVSSLARDTFWTILTTAVSTVVGFIFFANGLSDINVVTFYILGILINAIITKGVLFSLFSSILSVLAYNYFFTVPRFTFHAYGMDYPITFLTMFLAGMFTAVLAKKLKSQTMKSMDTAYRTKLLFDMNRLLQKTENEDQIMEVTCGQIRKLLDRSIVYYPYQDGKLGDPRVTATDAENEKKLTTVNEKAVANWVCVNNASAGAKTDTLSNAECLYFALRGNNGVYGAVGIEMKGAVALVGFEYNLLLSILGEASSAIERYRITKEREEARSIARNEQLKTNILRAISHDLRTPLASISGNADLLVGQNSYNLTEAQRKTIAEDIHDDSMYLINLVENLLSVTRIEDGSMKLRMNAEVVDEVIDEAVKHVNRYQDRFTLNIRHNDDIIMARMDARLIVQVIINLIDNAVKYSGSDCHIDVSSYRRKDLVYICIADNGCGVPDEQKEKIFEMFYSVHNRISDSRRSLGLGLALCRSIVQSHGGRIYVTDNTPRGSVFTFTLPAADIDLGQDMVIDQEEQE